MVVSQIELLYTSQQKLNIMVLGFKRKGTTVIFVIGLQTVVE
jgi:hypothetical protein